MLVDHFNNILLHILYPDARNYEAEVEVMENSEVGETPIEPGEADIRSSVVSQLVTHISEIAREISLNEIFTDGSLSVWFILLVTTVSAAFLMRKFRTSKIRRTTPFSC